LNLQDHVREFGTVIGQTKDEDFTTEDSFYKFEKCYKQISYINSNMIQVFIENEIY